MNHKLKPLIYSLIFATPIYLYATYMFSYIPDYDSSFPFDKEAFFFVPVLTYGISILLFHIIFMKTTINIVKGFNEYKRNNKKRYLYQNLFTFLIVLSFAHLSLVAPRYMQSIIFVLYLIIYILIIKIPNQYLRAEFNNYKKYFRDANIFNFVLSFVVLINTFLFIRFAGNITGNEVGDFLALVYTSGFLLFLLFASFVVNVFILLIHKNYLTKKHNQPQGS